MSTILDSGAVARAQIWLNSPIDEADKISIRSMQDSDPAAFNEAFYTELLAKKEYMDHAYSSFNARGKTFDELADERCSQTTFDITKNQTFVKNFI